LAKITCIICGKKKRRCGKAGQTSFFCSPKCRGIGVKKMKLSEIIKRVKNGESFEAKHVYENRLTTYTPIGYDELTEAYLVNTDDQYTLCLPSVLKYLASQK
jgi:endogenous inhibitor of DNA gyrase (YacG/DUF329 family)